MTPLTDAAVLATAQRTGWTLELATGGHRVWRGRLGGDATAFVIADPNVVADPALRQVVLARHVVMFEGRCPLCAARIILPSRAQRRRLRRKRQVGHAPIHHEHECPVSDDAMAETAAARFN
ncbi:MAG: hypothetical protein M3P44_11740 [Actinomycetota bacterium]|nr:hypothetical protein [Actinomycetota bacterium]